MTEREISINADGMKCQFIPSILFNSFQKNVGKAYMHISIVRSGIPDLREIIESLSLWMYDAKRVNMQLEYEWSDSFSLMDVEVTNEERILFIEDVTSILNRGGYFYCVDDRLINPPLKNIW